MINANYFLLLHLTIYILHFAMRFNYWRARQGSNHATSPIKGSPKGASPLWRPDSVGTVTPEAQGNPSPETSEVAGNDASVLRYRVTPVYC